MNPSPFKDSIWVQGLGFRLQGVLGFRDHLAVKGCGGCNISTEMGACVRILCIYIQHADFSTNRKTPDIGPSPGHGSQGGTPEPQTPTHMSCSLNS